jgi:hypothetical protein
LSTQLYDKLKAIKSSKVDWKVRAERVSLTNSRSLVLDGEEIPYDLLPTVFETLSHQKIVYHKSNGLNRTCYSLNIQEDKFQFNRFDNGDFEYTVNGVLHCANGPAKRTATTEEFYKRGALHNAAGSAVVSSDGSKKYYLDGLELSLHAFLERSPLAKHTFGIRGDKSFAISKLGEYASFSGLDGTIALLEKSNEQHNVDDFLLDLVGSHIPGYKVFVYENLGRNLLPVYNYLQNDKSDWKVSLGSEVSRASYDLEDGTRAVLSFSKKTSKLTHKIRLPSGDYHYSTTNFSYDPLGLIANEVLFADTSMTRDLSNRLHSTKSAAVKFGALEHFFIHGRKVSHEEFVRFDDKTDSISFRNAAGNLHRPDGPALINFNMDGSTSEYWFRNGILIETSKEAQLINSTEKTMTAYTELNMENKDSQSKFEEALKRVAKKAKAPDPYTGEPMEVKTVKHGEAKAATTDSRRKQVFSGAKVGMQKAALRIGSKKVAEKIVEAVAPTDNVVFEKIAQLALLLGSAELAERLPDGPASKVGLTEARRANFGGMARYLAGETLGRDAVSIVDFVAPLLLDKLQGITAQEISELTEDAQEVERLEALSVGVK